MITKVEPLRPDHLENFNIQESQKHFRDLISRPDEYVAMVSEGEAFALVVDGETMSIAGLIEMWPGRSLFWSLMSANCKPHMVTIVKVGRRLVKMFGGKRVEANVECDFEQGHRLMKLMGFQMEAERMRNFEPDGRDCALYARIQ